LLLRREDREISAAFTKLFGRRVRLLAESKINRVSQIAGGPITVSLVSEGEQSTISGEVLLVATGRIPNGDTLNLAATGVDVDEDGFIIVDDHQQTTAPGIFALGDVCSHQMLKHVANAEARVVKHNLLHPQVMINSDHRFVPHAVFSDPQVAAVGLTEEQARERGIEARIGREAYGDTAYGWAMEDTEHFVKVLADPDGKRLIGAHIIGPQASSLIQPLIQAMSFGTPVRAMARDQYWIHPAMAEVVENALLDLRD